MREPYKIAAATYEPLENAGKVRYADGEILKFRTYINSRGIRRVRLLTTRHEIPVSSPVRLQNLRDWLTRFYPWPGNTMNRVTLKHRQDDVFDVVSYDGSHGAAHAELQMLEAQAALSASEVEALRRSGWQVIEQ